MKSIRLSLLLYFLGLFTVALGVASVLIYQTAQRSLLDKEAATRNLIETKYQQASRDEQWRFDRRLWEQAHNLARHVQIRYDEPGYSAAVASQIGLLAPLPDAGTPLRALLAEALPPFQGSRLPLAHLELPHQDPEEEPADRLARREFFQIECDVCARPLCSPDLASFPPAVEFAFVPRFRPDADDFRLSSGETVRRVRVKVPRFARGVGPAPRSGRDRGWPEPPPPPPPGWVPRAYPPSIVVQFAAEPTRLAELRRQHDADLVQEQEGTERSLSSLRRRLFLIGGLTFVATVFGTCWLAWLGLVPLRRLSDAVSRVSPRDFRLDVDEPALPAELRPIARRLSATLTMLKRAFAREKQAVADISHELRTPLAALLTTIELALRKPRQPEQYREMLLECQGSARQINQIIERMLTLARLDAGADLLRPQSVDVGELAEQCAALVRPLAEASGLRLAVHNHCEPAPEGAPGPARLTTDPDKLREVINNLLHNAVQYNRPAGRIDLCVDRANGCVVVEVRDTGVGIRPEHVEHVFERFYRADPSRNTDGLNAGLGLALAREYADLLGASIAVESAVGKGSTFRVRIPVPGKG